MLKANIPALSLAKRYFCDGLWPIGDPFPGCIMEYDDVTVRREVYVGFKCVGSTFYSAAWNDCIVFSGKTAGAPRWP